MSIVATVAHLSYCSALVLCGVSIFAQLNFVQLYLLATLMQLPSRVYIQC